MSNYAKGCVVGFVLGLLLMSGIIVLLGGMNI